MHDRRRKSINFSIDNFLSVCYISDKTGSLPIRIINMFPSLCTHGSRDLFSRVYHARLDIMADTVESSLTAHRPLAFAIRSCHPELVIMSRFWNAYSYYPPNSPNAWGGCIIWVMGGCSFFPLPFLSSRPHVHRARARVSRSPYLVRQVSHVSFSSTKCSLADPNLPAPRTASNEIIIIFLPN